mmetsp:Transcript_47383/g.125090  ORF Transcript_47383/g.125090 Transcript_47383/m.125090 type:complete len:204 (-) Transcript_47383:339-950(-)
MRQPGTAPHHLHQPPHRAHRPSHMKVETKRSTYCTLRPTHHNTYTCGMHTPGSRTRRDRVDGGEARATRSVCRPVHPTRSLPLNPSPRTRHKRGAMSASRAVPNTKRHRRGWACPSLLAGACRRPERLIVQKRAPCASHLSCVLRVVAGRGRAAIGPPQRPTTARRSPSPCARTPCGSPGRGAPPRSWPASWGWGRRGGTGWR